MLLGLVLTMVMIGQPPMMVQAGAGGHSCGEWTVAYEGHGDIPALKKAMMTSWVQGFVIGAAQMIGVVLSGSEKALTLADSQKKFGTVSGWAFDPPDGDAIEQWVVKHCRDNPLERLAESALALVAEVFSKK